MPITATRVQTSAQATPYGQLSATDRWLLVVVTFFTLGVAAAAAIA